LTSDKISIDSINVTPDEARELMIHHLLLAQRFFEALDEQQLQQTREEIIRILEPETAAMRGAIAFVGELERYYDELEKELDDQRG